MIPTMILLGLVLGRWWRVALVTAALGWPILLVATDAMNFEPGLIASTSLSVLNAGAGVLIHQGVLWTYRQVRRALASRPRP